MAAGIYSHKLSESFVKHEFEILRDFCITPDSEIENEISQKDSQEEMHAYVRKLIEERLKRNH